MNDQARQQRFPLAIWPFAVAAACAAFATERTAPIRSVQVELPGQHHNAIALSLPGVGCWFWTADEFEPDGYQRFIDLHEKHSAYRYLTTSIRHPVEVTDPAVHDRIKAAAEYARAHGMEMVMDLDVRLARKAFMTKYPNELQEIARLREFPLHGAGEVTFAVESMSLGDHYTFRAPPYSCVSSRLLRVYSYVAGADGVDPVTVQDITQRCEIVTSSNTQITAALQCQPDDSGRTACVIAAFALFTPDVFAPHLIAFERTILDQYADVPLAGACKDEWGFPGRFDPRTDDLWYSSFMADAYAARRPGHDLVRDLVLMSKGENGRDGERTAAINHYMEMGRKRNAEVENQFYAGIKEVFGRNAISATHPTWFAFPSANEAFKNGLDWWSVTRDLAQTDEGTPLCARTALAKKWRSPLWLNMYYDSAVASYEEDLWRHALGGGRMNFHPVYPRPDNELNASLLTGDLLRADARVRLLNYISTAPIDCPVAVVFGHASSLNWAGTGFGDVGLDVTNRLWETGYYADLIPSSEIAAGALEVGGSGRISYGLQTYEAAVLYRPQYERSEVADFFARAAAGSTRLYRVGDWTLDFEGKPFDGNAALPSTMRAGDAGACANMIIDLLREARIEPQTPCTMRGAAGYPASMMPEPSGRCRLLDGTVILASGKEHVMGDPISETIDVDGHQVRFDAVGIAAVRLRADGRLDAMAAGGLKSFKTDRIAIDLTERVDVALFHDANGNVRGVIQGLDGEVPAALKSITQEWIRLRLPEPLKVGAN